MNTEFGSKDHVGDRDALGRVTLKRMPEKYCDRLHTGSRDS
jgi:hypothetical protein